MVASTTTISYWYKFSIYFHDSPLQLHDDYETKNEIHAQIICVVVVQAHVYICKAYNIMWLK